MVLSETEATSSGRHSTCMKKSQFSYSRSIGNALARHSIPAQGMSNGRRTASNMLTQRMFPESSNFKAEINKCAKIPEKRRFTFEASRAVGLCDTQRYDRECVTHFYNLGVNIVLIWVTSYSYWYDRTFRNISLTAIKFCNTNSRVESFNAEFEVGL